MSSFKFEAWPTEFQTITQHFGANPQNYAQFGLPGHEGLDIRAPSDSKVFAVAPGQVKMVNTDPTGHNYGTHVRISHDDGYETIYAHLDEALVAEGDEITSGQQIGIADNTGNSFGSHLHLTLKKDDADNGDWGKIIDPTPFAMRIIGWERPSGPFTEGWVYNKGIVSNGTLAQVSPGGVNLRAEPSAKGELIDLVPGGTVIIVTGDPHVNFTPVKVPTRALKNPPPPPIEEPQPKPPQTVATVDGWGYANYLTVIGDQALVGEYGINLRSEPNRDATNIGLVNGRSTVEVRGDQVGEYLPIRVQLSDMRAPVNLPDSPPPDEKPIHDSTPGWGFSTQMTVAGDTAVTGTYGINLRDKPNRTAANIGFVPADSEVIVTGSAVGEYTPIRVDDNILQPPFDAARAIAPGTGGAGDIPKNILDSHPNPDPTPLASADIGLHASADPTISDAEISTFTAFRPGIIKLLSFHDPAAVQKLAAAHPDASWIVRAFLDFGGRRITPQQFFDYTINDMRRTLAILRGRDVVIELHNEPNLVVEGLGSSWADGGEFARWWLELLRIYRNALPSERFIYPGLSPGSDVRNQKHDHIRFVEASRQAVEAADGLGIHLYWSKVYKMEKALDVLDDYISRFRYKHIWITEASNNKGGVRAYTKAQQYLKFWHALQARPTVQGVTYFVASASNPAFAEEVFLGRNMAEVIGRR